MTFSQRTTTCLRTLMIVTPNFNSAADKPLLVITVCKLSIGRISTYPWLHSERNNHSCYFVMKQKVVNIKWPSVSLVNIHVKQFFCQEEIYDSVLNVWNRKKYILISKLQMTLNMNISWKMDELMEEWLFLSSYYKQLSADTKCAIIRLKSVFSPEMPKARAKKN